MVKKSVGLCKTTGHPARDSLHFLEPPQVQCYSPSAMPVDPHAKALFITICRNSPTALSCINRLTPDYLCFFLPEDQKETLESQLQPFITKMPQRWDWILTSDPDNFAASHQVLATKLPDLLTTWGIHRGELVVNFTEATPAMAAATALVTRPFTSRVVLLQEATPSTQESENIWDESNPWNEEAVQGRREAASTFNQGAFPTAAKQFRLIESMVSGSQKPLYHALANLADGYHDWECFHYKEAWDKLKTALKALELASVWGGPSGLTQVLGTVKANAGFLEKIVLDPQEVKTAVADDLLAHAKRRADRDHNYGVAVAVIIRALEAYGQLHLWKQFTLKTWDVQVEQLPQPLQELCRTSFLDDIDGKYKLPLYAQFQTLAELGHPLGKSFATEWPKMKSLLDATYHNVLGHGFQPPKAERFHQLYQVVLKLTDVNEGALPKFPIMTL